MPKTIAFLDACVLYPPSLRDLLMWPAVYDSYEPRWTQEIHNEWIRNVLADKPALTPAQLDRTCCLMNRAVPNGLISGYEAHIPTLSLPDQNDRHVLAAAIESRAAVIVKFNLSDFPAAALREYEIVATHPDLFLSALFDDDSELFLRAIREHRACLKNPPKSPDDYIATLRANGLKWLASRLEPYSHDI